MLINPETYKSILADKEFYAKYEKLKKQLGDEMEQWESLLAHLEEKEKEEAVFSIIMIFYIFRDTLA